MYRVTSSRASRPKSPNPKQTASSPNQRLKSETIRIAAGPTELGMPIHAHAQLLRMAASSVCLPGIATRVPQVSCANTSAKSLESKSYQVRPRCGSARSPNLGSRTNECSDVHPHLVLNRLSRAKDRCCDPKLIIVDLRESRLYQEAHLLTARSANCYTKTMAKRAVTAWNFSYSEKLGCPAPASPQNLIFSPQPPTHNVTSIVVYDQRSANPPCLKNESAQQEGMTSMGLFISSLLQLGNRVFFLSGGIEAFLQLPGSSDFIDRGGPALSLPSLTSQFPFQGFDWTACEFDDHPPAISVRVQSPNLQSNIRVSGCNKGQDLSLPLSELATTAGNLATGGESPSTASPALINSTDTHDDVMSAGISKVLPFLYLGNAQDAQNMELLCKLGITHILNVTDCVPMIFERLQRFRYLRLPACDNTQQDLRPAFDAAIQFIDEARRSNGIVLVHCMAGVSRSVAVVMAYLLRHCSQLTVLEALDFVQTRRPVAGPNLHFMGQLQRYYRETSKVENSRGISLTVTESSADSGPVRRGSLDSLLAEALTTLPGNMATNRIAEVTKGTNKFKAACSSGSPISNLIFSPATDSPLCLSPCSTLGSQSQGSSGSNSATSPDSSKSYFPINSTSVHSFSVSWPARKTTVAMSGCVVRKLNVTSSPSSKQQVVNLFVKQSSEKPVNTVSRK